MGSPDVRIRLSRALLTVSVVFIERLIGKKILGAVTAVLLENLGVYHVPNVAPQSSHSYPS